jgi:tetratricopeptide (TPR) repeat protein
MSSNAPSVSPAGRARRWRVPPPLTRGGELLEGAEILGEVEGPVAVLLWKSLRSVSLWAAAGPREQADLFSHGARERREAEVLASNPDPELREPLRLFAELLGRPTRVRRDAVALACRQVTQWADARGARETALAFSQLAALACPGDAALAHEVGRQARRLVQHARAESWYRRAVMLARQSGDWNSYGRAYLGLGNLAMQRGSLPAARRAHIKALRSSRRHGLVEIQAMALHDLFVVANESGEARTAQRYARAAFRLYGAGHANLPSLAHDISLLWLGQGEFARAQAVLSVLLPHFDAPGQLLGTANLARAAAGAGDREGFESAWSRATERLPGLRSTHWAAQSLLNLARAATLLGEWDRAEETARDAVRLADSHRQANIVFEAERLLDEVRGNRAAGTPLAAPVAKERTEEWSLEAEELEEGLVEALTVGAAGVPRRRWRSRSVSGAHHAAPAARGVLGAARDAVRGGPRMRGDARCGDLGRAGGGSRNGERGEDEAHDLHGTSGGRLVRERGTAREW